MAGRRGARAETAVKRDAGLVRWLGAGFVVLALAGWAVAAHAQEATVSHAITTFGDPPKYAADFPHLDYVNPDAPKGGEISIWTAGGFDSMNPYSVKGRAAALASAPYESILTGTSDEIGTSYCLLCTTMEYPADRSWVIFNLRPEVTFADGSPMTAEDVAFSFNIFLTKGLTDFRTIFGQQVEGVEVLEPHKVKFTFKPDIPTRDLPALVGGLPVLSKAHYEANKLDLEESSLTPFLGTGQYVLDRMDVGKNIVWKRNPDYWGNDLPINKGRGNFDFIRVEYYGDYQAAFEGFKAGNYTFRNEASSITWATGYDFPAMADGTVKKVELPSGAKASGQAFELAATGVPTPEEVAILQALVDEGLLPATMLTDEAVMAPTSGERQLDRGNVRKASALLDEAGWTVGDDGLRRNAAGEVLTVEFLNDSPSFDRVFNPYVENLKAIGIDAKMTSIDNAQMEARTRPPQYDFDIITGNARSDYISGSELKQYYGAETADVSSFNLMGLKSPAVDRLIDVVMAADSNEKLKVATKALDRVLRAERFWVPQWFKAKHTIAYYDMYEHPETLPPYALGELDFWWYNADKAEALRASGALK